MFDRLVLLILLLFGGSKADKVLAPFICFDGTSIPLSEICNGVVHCPDSSDETANLCLHIVCPKSMYKCAYGACISRDQRCDGSEDCIDGSDEIRCDQESTQTCSDVEFQCSTANKECLPRVDLCNGHVDCSDGSDEDTAICWEYPCSSAMFRCAYGGCVHEELICDGTKDCVDGSDEDSALCVTSKNCSTGNCKTRECREHEFSCQNGEQCVPETKVCDGTRHCRDTSDEDSKMCLKRECPNGSFRCRHGACIPSELKCNHRPDCYDWSDEEEPLCGSGLPQGACRLPGPRPATHYQMKDCPHCRPGDIVPYLTRLDYSCSEEGSVAGSLSTYCRNGKWIPAPPICQADNETQITCPPISDAYGAVKKCEVKWGPHKGWVHCDKPLPVGTRVTLVCPSYYTRESGTTSVVCLHDGTWSRRPLRCIPKCGIMDSSAIALIVRGWRATLKDVPPWQASLFSQQDGEWVAFCGGTLISERVVLTAAHCIWKTNPTTILVVLGTLSSNLDEAGETAQRIELDRIEVQNTYQDYEGNYGSDIALLILKKPAILNAAVRPACVDWYSDITLRESQENGGLGIVAGMGLTENNTYGPYMRMTTLKIIEESECRSLQKKDFRKYLTYTIFCAGWTNGTGVCNGDSGGGLVLRRPNSTIWEVHGVVSISPRQMDTSFCDLQYYTVFTKVAIYATWIRDIVQSIHVEGPPEAAWKPNNDFTYL